MLERIKNKEVRTILYDCLNIVPQNPVEFLRVLVYRASGETLLIKNHNLIKKLKDNPNHLGIISLLHKYKSEYGLEKLSEIFYRFKPLFLTLRTSKGAKQIINRVRRLAKNNHMPMPEDYLDTVTSKLKNSEGIDIKELKTELKKVNLFRKIRLAYALKYRTLETDSILYKIRNGKSYASNFTFYELTSTLWK